MSSPQLSPDRPITDTAQDALGRAALARLIAAEISAAPADSGIVISLMGPWGSGKTSVLNLVEAEVGENVEVLRFNPWLFSGAQELVTRFFAELAVQLRGSTDEKLRGAADKVVSYGSALSPILKLVLGSRGEAVGALLQGADSARQVAESSVLEQYQELRDALSESERRIAVFVDDIDRLTADEVREVVRLVKLVGDLPRVSYVLAFDRRRVEAALADHTEDGRAYLEKIIQVPHDLPAIPAASLRKLALDELQAVIGDRPLHHFDLDGWSRIFGLGIAPMLATMRDAKRYANIAPAALELVGDEVAAHDVLGLEALRIFEPDVYAALPELVEALTDSGGIDLRDRSVIDQERRAQVDEALKDARRLEPVKELFQALFPAAGHLLGGSRYGGDRAWRRDRRVASREVLDFYLAATLGEGALATSEVKAIVEAVSRPDELKERLGQVSPEQMSSLLDRLRDYANELPSDPTGQAGLIFMELEDHVPEAPGMFQMPSSWAVHAVVIDLLQRVPDDDRPAAVRGMYEAAASLSVKQRVLRLFGTFPDRERRRSEEEMLDEAATEGLVEDLRRRTAEAPAAELAAEPDLTYLLAALITHDEEAGRALIVEKAQDDAFLHALLSRSLSFARRSSGVSVKKIPKLDWSGLQSLLGEEVLRAKIAELAERRDDLDDHLREALALAERYAAGDPPGEFD